MIVMPKALLGRREHKFTTWQEVYGRRVFGVGREGRALRYKAASSSAGLRTLLEKLSF